jgi:hypothetical protein
MDECEELLVSELDYIMNTLKAQRVAGQVRTDAKGLVLRVDSAGNTECYQPDEWKRRHPGV